MDWGKIYGDAGYISKKPLRALPKGDHIIDQDQEKYKNKLLTMKDKMYLKKRTLVGIIIDLLKKYAIYAIPAIEYR